LTRYPGIRGVKVRGVSREINQVKRIIRQLHFALAESGEARNEQRKDSAYFHEEAFFRFLHMRVGSANGPLGSGAIVNMSRVESQSPPWSGLGPVRKPLDHSKAPSPLRSAGALHDAGA
jgi:hypothetical protein